MQTKKILGIALAAALVGSMATVAAVSVSAADFDVKSKTLGIVGNINGNWDTDTAMTDPDGDGIYTGVVKNVAAGDYQFKVRADGKWDDSWGVYEKDYDRTYNSQTNCSISLDSTANVVVSIDTNGSDYNVWPVTFYKYVPQTKYNFGIVGNINGNWDTDTAMTDDDGDGIYTGVVKNVAAGDYQFKLRSDGKWDDSWGVYEADYDRTYNSQTNCSVSLKAASDVTVSIDVTGDDNIVWPITYSYTDENGKKQTVYTGKAKTPVEESSTESSTQSSAAESSKTESSATESKTESSANTSTASQVSKPEIKEDTTKNYVFYDNSETKWDKVYAYWWNADLGTTVNYAGEEYPAGEFPGVEMTQVPGTDTWQIMIPYGATKIIFGNGVNDVDMQAGTLSYQTNDLDLTEAQYGQIFKIDTTTGKAGRGIEKTKTKYDGAWSDYSGDFVKQLDLDKKVSDPTANISSTTESSTDASTAASKTTSTASKVSGTSNGGTTNGGTTNGSTDTPATGDANMAIAFVVVGAAALGAVVLASKKKSFKD